MTAGSLDLLLIKHDCWFSRLTIDSTWLLVLWTYYWLNMTAGSLDLLLIHHDCWFSGLTIAVIIILINLI